VKYIVGIDPGETTGYISTRLHNNGNLEVVEAKEFVWSKRFELMPQLGSMIEALRADDPSALEIVMESFFLYPHKARHQIGNYFPSVRVIGVVEAVLWQHNVLSQLTMQPAANMSRVKILHPLPASPHIRAAYKHVRYFVTIKYHMKGGYSASNIDASKT
jgi:hypothetical protein